jgi:hypothetical protein
VVRVFLMLQPTVFVLHMKKILRPLFKKTGLLQWRRDKLREQIFARESASARLEWEASGRPAPPPSIVKYELIAEHQARSGARSFVETGTWRGHSLFHLRRTFDELHSIELMPELYVTNCRTLRHFRNVFLYHGNSGSLLAAILKDMPQPCVFWLDGHYSGPGTARAESDTPIMEELEAVFALPPGKNTVLIDDARLFTGADGYPTLEFLKSATLSARPNAAFVVESDVVQIWDV